MGKLFLLGFLLISLVSPAQSRKEKTQAIMEKMRQVEVQKAIFEQKIESFKNIASTKDSIRIVELEKKITEKELNKRITNVYDKILSDEQINTIYTFQNSTAHWKFQVLSSRIMHEFQDFNDELKSVSKSINN